jgi:hypothetical protein
MVCSTFWKDRIVSSKVVVVIVKDSFTRTIIEIGILEHENLCSGWSLKRLF